jgi:hypothetical protein
MKKLTLTVVSQLALVDTSFMPLDFREKTKAPPSLDWS